MDAGRRYDRYGGGRSGGGGRSRGRNDDRGGGRGGYGRGGRSDRGGYGQNNQTQFNDGAGRYDRGGYGQNNQTQFNDGAGRYDRGGHGQNNQTQFNDGAGRYDRGGYGQNNQTQFNEGGGSYGRVGYGQNDQTQFHGGGGGGGGGGRRGRDHGYYRGDYENNVPHHPGGDGGSIGRGVCSRKPSGPSSTPSSNRQTHSSPIDSAELDVQSHAKGKPVLPSSGDIGNKLLPMKRPDWGTLAKRPVSLLANHFPVRFDSRSIIMHYDVDIKPAGNQSLKRSIPETLSRSIKDELFSDNSSQFPVDMVAYDGKKNLFSAVELPVGEFIVELTDGDHKSARSYLFTIKEVSRLKLSKLTEYLAGSTSDNPRDILQAMGVVMNENPSKYRVKVGGSYYCKNYRQKDDLGCGVAAYRGLSQSLKPTSQGLSLCLDYSVLAFRKPLPVLDFLKEHIEDFKVVNDVIRLRGDVINALKGLKVTVTHRKTKQKYTISGLTEEPTKTLSFDRIKPDSPNSVERIGILKYFKENYGIIIKHPEIPCLDIGKPNKVNYVPMECCLLIEGQRYPKELLDRDGLGILKNISLVVPEGRKSSICEMVQAKDGPCGVVAKAFDMEVVKTMTKVQGRVLGAPELRLRATNGNINPVTVDPVKCQWNLVGKSVVVGQRVERWAVIDFSTTNNYRNSSQDFIEKLRNRSLKLGMFMEEPLTCYSAGMREFSSVERIDKLLRKVVSAAEKTGLLQDKQLQVIVCIMTRRDPGYKYLKWVSETKIGVVTQCCLSFHASKGQDQYLANLCLKINAKVGGSNVELNERLPHFVHEDNVMLIGADVNHPAAGNSSCPSIAAVVGTINWPATNRYAARIQPQEHRKEKIMNFGEICLDLVKTFVQHNKCRPKKIIIFRDGVSEGQFDMVLNEELVDFWHAISDEHYRPTVTLVVAQKRHHTRLFADRGNGTVENVPPGTVVDTTIIHPSEFDFYLCSHYGSLGTSKPTHYYALYDGNGFTADELQKLIYNLCFTYARCTKPVSLVPPVYYADLVAYRGRLFQEVAMEQANASSGPSASSPSSFQQKFYTLHPDLQNMMFFV